MGKIVSAKEASKLIKDGDTVAIIGNGGGVLEPKLMYKSIEERFFEEGSPRNLTLIHSAGIGDKDREGINRFAHEGMVKRVIGGHWGWSPKMQKMAIDDKIEAYNLPQGVIVSNYREIAAKRPGLITKIGLKTFVDPRVDGAKLNGVTKEDIVELIDIGGEEWLHYKTPKINVGIVRGTTADENGNITFEHEATMLEAVSLAQAAHNCGGKVICQVKYLAKAGTMDPRMVKIPGFYIDAVVVDEGQWQTSAGEFDPSLCGTTKKPTSSFAAMPLTHRKVIGRRASMIVDRGSVINLGFGMPDGVAAVAQEEGFADSLTMTIEQGLVGGVPAGGDIFGVAYNPDVLLDAPTQFDFYSGHGLDLTCLGLAQCDQYGNVNVSKFGTTISGCGGFIDISQTSKKCVFCGTFTAGGLKTEIRDGEIHILQEGRNRKFISNVEHVTFSGEYARETNQEVYYVTERAVFEMTSEGMVLVEIAPGIDLKTQILDQMDFEPIISDDLKLMDPRIFREEKMGI